MTHGYHKRLEEYVTADGLSQSGALVSEPEAGARGVVCVGAKLKLARHHHGQGFLLWTWD